MAERFQRVSARLVARSATRQAAERPCRAVPKLLDQCIEHERMQQRNPSDPALLAALKSAQQALDAAFNRCYGKSKAQLAAAHPELLSALSSVPE